jgi:hypothetical protein
MYQIQTSPNIKTGFMSLGSTYAISFYLIYKAYVMKWKYLGALVYYPGITNPLYNTIHTWKCSIITTHVCRADDGSMLTYFCDRRRTFTKYLRSYLKQIVCCILRHSFYIFGFVVWRILAYQSFSFCRSVRDYKIHVDKEIVTFLGIERLNQLRGVQ